MHIIRIKISIALHGIAPFINGTRQHLPPIAARIPETICSNPAHHGGDVDNGDGVRDNYQLLQQSRRARYQEPVVLPRPSTISPYGLPAQSPSASFHHPFISTSFYRHRMVFRQVCGSVRRHLSRLRRVEHGVYRRGYSVVKSAGPFMQSENCRGRAGPIWL